MYNRRRAKQSTNGNYLPSQRQRLSRQTVAAARADARTAGCARDAELPRERRGQAQPPEERRAHFDRRHLGLRQLEQLGQQDTHTEGRIFCNRKQEPVGLDSKAIRSTQWSAQWSSGRRHSFGRKCSRQCRQVGPTVALCALQHGDSMSGASSTNRVLWTVGKC